MAWEVTLLTTLQNRKPPHAQLWSHTHTHTHTHTHAQFSHLRRRKVEHAGQVLPLRGGQVALLPEPPLKLVGLRLGEQDPPLFFLARDRARVAEASALQRKLTD